MKIEALHDKAELASFLSQDTGLYVYGLADLDPFFWPHTLWLGLKDPDLKAILLLYLGQTPPTLLALSRDTTPLKELIQHARGFLPAQMYGHISVDVQEAFGPADFASQGIYHRMVLETLIAPKRPLNAQLINLNITHLPQLLTFYQAAYPDNWFDPRMLETGHYWGAFVKEELLAVAGVHAYSAPYQCAALGNIATHTKARGQGLASWVTYRVCQGLEQAGVKTIGLNVAAQNTAAIQVYKSLGFTPHAEFEETKILLRY